MVCDIIQRGQHQKVLAEGEEVLKQKEDISRPHKRIKTQQLYTVSSTLSVQLPSGRNGSASE